MLTLQTPLSQALRTTQFHLQRLKQLGLETISDFLRYFPRTYTDQREVRNILEIQINEQNTVRGAIKSIETTATWRKRMAVITALISDKTGSIEAVWFNQPYLARTFKKGNEIIISGKVKYDAKKNRVYFQSPAIELIRQQQIHTGRIVPVYHETDLNSGKRVQGKISSKWIREKLFPILPYAEYFPEYLPEHIRREYKLIKLNDAIRNIHFPTSEKNLDEAKKRLSFDELFLLQLAALHRRYLWRKIAMNEQKKNPPDWELIKKFTASLPWPLTNAQKKAIYEILKDLDKSFPMSRLLEGDTGSGKTVVAAAACLSICASEFQSCLLAPTEILARQHWQSFSKLLAPFNITPTLLIGATNAKEKKQITEKMKNGEIKLIIGTHALIQENIGFKSLALAIIDEQHRFGVKQREKLKTFGSPHVLNLTATPIPRTLALILYGDQDLSVLDEMPPGRQKIITRIVPEEKRKNAYRWIEKEIKKGKQAFIIFPLIEESEILEVKAATQEFERLRADIFPNLKIGLLHGQMESQEKAQIMRAFKDGKTNILVSTAVVEVGVDVPNATIMIIEGAERFGLAQLHQFRGRVGRGSDQSFCFLFPTFINSQNIKRLNSLVKYNCGFKLAEIDLNMRGPGEIYGAAQSGIPDLKMANLGDPTTIKQAREAAETIIEKDPELNSHPELKKKILEQQNISIDY